METVTSVHIDGGDSMYCVIQVIENKKVKYHPTSKRIEVSPTTWTMNGVTETFYSYTYSSEKFERPIKKAYKISIHKSYRDRGKIKKKQCVICTMGYYDLINSWPGDFLTSSKLAQKLEFLEINEDELWDMTWKKLEPIVNEVTKEYQQTEEYKAEQEQRKIMDNYHKVKKKFEEQYGEDTYKYCYDIFGVLRNEAYLNELKKNYEAQQQYKRSYQDYNYSNYNYSNYQTIGRSTYTSEEKELAEKVIQAGYKVLAKQFHPDVGGTKEQFQQLGNIKEKLLEITT